MEREGDKGKERARLNGRESGRDNWRQRVEKEWKRGGAERRLGRMEERGREREKGGVRGDSVRERQSNKDKSRRVWIFSNDKPKLCQLNV